MAALWASGIWEPPMLPASILTRVRQQTSARMELFRGFTNEHLRTILDPPVGEFLLRLPVEPATDGDWIPVLGAYIGHEGQPPQWLNMSGIQSTPRYQWHSHNSLVSAFFGYVHPGCIEDLPDALPLGPIDIGHVERRGANPPSHHLGRRLPGPRPWNEVPSLDARWERAGEDYDRACSGYCSSVCLETARNPLRMAHILIFAILQTRGVICCQHGKHRSLSAGLILLLLFHRRIQVGAAFGTPTRRCYNCRDPICDNIPLLLRTVRTLPPPPQELTLAQSRR